MPDKTRDVSQTGKISRAELEPHLTQIKRETPRPTTVPELPEEAEAGSTTGIMPIYREPADDTAKRDEDAPAV